MNGQDNKKLRRVIVLGNCAAERLRFMLEKYAGFTHSFQMVPAPMIHTVNDPAAQQKLADLALGCDIVFTQPLFNFGPCNTAELRKALGKQAECGEAGGQGAFGASGQRLFVFSSPDFDAYFPDAVYFRNMENVSIVPVMEWDSSIIFSCYCQGVSIFDVEKVYLDHPMFKAEAVAQRVAPALERYALREQGLDIGSQSYFFKNYASAKLLHSPRHPVDGFLQALARGLAGALGLDQNAAPPPLSGFGFNQWPVITRHYRRFTFAEQPWFMVAGKKYSIEDVAMAYYNFYKFNPHVVEANQDKIIEI